ncbi:MAG: hypothetical protein ACI9K2_004590 [Myxococcota bacterium]|jgi:hypothetical protein
MLLLAAAIASAGVPALADLDLGPLCRPAPERLSGPPGNQLHRVVVRTAPDPDDPAAPFAANALCNDGSPAEYYVRPGTGPDAANWLVYFDGGEGCYDWQTCVARWCGAGFYTRDKMTSDGSPDTVAGLGALFPDPVRNPFADWTHVSVPYCSSDFWTGNNPLAVVSDPRFPDLSYTLAFNGAAIADAVVAELATGTPEHVELGLPPMVDAARILVTGSSAGALGLALTVDRHAAVLQSGAPDADIRAVFDSYFPPGGEVTGGGAYTGEFSPEGRAYIDAFAATSAGPAFWNSGSDASCLAAHPHDSAVCLEAQHVLMNHVHTPYFVYMDQHDPVVCPGPCAAGVRDQVAALARIAVDGPEREGSPEYPPDTPPGWFAPRCGVHTALATGADGGARFVGHVLPVARDAEPPFLAYASALSNWVFDAGPSQLIRAADGPGPDCPARR